MAYKVFLVEDEITTREGIRDSVNWQQAGFELCGEASDGEIALPQIEMQQPDVLFTDIKMPFMDGLQLCKIVREHMPWMKIVIISGYNDFQYAQTAIQLGVTEYLLKPVSVQNIQGVLAKIAVVLDGEKREREYLKKLRSQVEDNLFLLREKFLLHLVMGGESSLSAIEQSQQLGLNILSPWYQVLFLELRPSSDSFLVTYPLCQQVEGILAEIVGSNKDVLQTKKDLEKFVLILKGENPDHLEQEGTFLAGLIADEVQKRTGLRITSGRGSPQNRLGDLHRSFSDALLDIQGALATGAPGKIEKLNHGGLRAFLESGQMSGFEPFFEQALRPALQAGLGSDLLKRYLIVDIFLCVSQFLSDLGGDAGPLISAPYEDDSYLVGLRTIEQVRLETQRLFGSALAFRDSQSENDRALIVQQAKAYILGHFSDSNLSLNEVAAQVNFSPNHFSAVFSEEIGETFRDHLTRTRLEQAKKLLLSTRLKCAEIAFRCGYNDPHYFSLIFRKNCGQTPQQYRASARG